jgi:hypothetical protein
MATNKFDLIIRLDESGQKFVFFTTRSSDVTGSQAQAGDAFKVEISLDDLKSRGSRGAEMLIGESVLGFFDQLTDGRLDLPKHYLDDND